MEFYIELSSSNETIKIPAKENVVIRFKGAVPAWVLIPHIIAMFLAMLISNLTGIMVIFKYDKFLVYGKIALLLLFIGGIILGPIVQKYAFNEFWTGVPFGWDLTDNKTLIAFLGWIIAVGVNLKNKRPALMLFASILLLLIYMIPHSMFGSELDHSTGEVTQGFIKVFSLFF